VTHGFGVFLRKSFWWGGFLGLLTDKEGRSSSEVKEEEEKKKATQSFPTDSPRMCTGSV